MYCKQCGHRSVERIEVCPKCGVKLSAELVVERPAKARVRWQVFAGAIVAAVVLFFAVPRIFLRTELETIGPTDRLRFLRAMERSDYRRAGQREIRLEQQTLVVIWDLRWNTLPEAKQRDIVRMVGHAWNVVGGEGTRIRIEGDDKDAAAYIDGKIRLGAESQ